MESIGKIFGENERVMSQVAVVNSLVPMKDRDEGNDGIGFYWTDSS